MGKTEKNWRENDTTKVIKTPKTKRQKYGMNKTKETNALRQFRNSWKTPILILGGEIEFTFIPEFDYLS